jgi:hypothetical protein
MKPLTPQEQNTYPLNTFTGETKRELVECMAIIKNNAIEGERARIKLLIPKERQIIDDLMKNERIRGWNSCIAEILQSLNPNHHDR